MSVSNGSKNGAATAVLPNKSKRHVGVIDTPEDDGAKVAKAADQAAKQAKTRGQATAFIIPKPRYLTAEIPIVGETSLIVHAWSRKAIDMMLAKQMNKPVNKKAPKNPEQDFKESLYVSQDGWYGFPANAFRAAMIDATRLVDNLTMTMAKLLFYVQADGYSADKKIGLIRIKGKPTMREDMVRIGNGKDTADIRYRGEFTEWSAVLRIRFNADQLSAEHVLNLVELAGMSCGIGEWRQNAPNSNTGDHGLWRLQGRESDGGRIATSPQTKAKRPRVEA